MKAKVTKVWVNPSRTINLGNYYSAKLDVGLELTFEKPVAIDGKEVKEAYKEAMKVIKEQFKVQYEPYKQYLESKRMKGGEKE